MRFSTLTLTALATLRLTRLVTRDTLGGWLLAEPAETWAKYHEGGVDPDSHQVYSPPTMDYRLPELLVDPDLGWRSKLVSGLSCPHCVGYWIGACVLAAGALSEKHPGAERVFRALAGSLGLSYLTGHASQRLDS